MIGGCLQSAAEIGRDADIGSIRVIFAAMHLQSLVQHYIEHVLLLVLPNGKQQVIRMPTKFLHIFQTCEALAAYDTVQGERCWIRSSVRVVLCVSPERYMLHASRATNCSYLLVRLWQRLINSLRNQGNIAFCVELDFAHQVFSAVSLTTHRMTEI